MGHQHHSHQEFHRLRRALPLSEHIQLERAETKDSLVQFSAHSLFSRAKDPCDGNSSSPQCEKPTSSGTTTVPIVLAAVIPICIAICVLIFIHRRHVKKQRLEDLNDRHKSLDFGLDEPPSVGEKKKKKTKAGPKDGPEMSLNDASAEVRGGRGLSMNLDSSPYLLPAGLHGSRESFHSMSRSTRDPHDPYRPVTFVRDVDSASMYGSAAGSIRNYPKTKADNSSTFTDSSGGTDAMNANLLRNASRMSKSYPPRGESVPTPVAEVDTPPTAPPAAHLPHADNRLAPAKIDAGRDSYFDAQNRDIRKSNNYLGQFIHSRDTSTVDAPNPATAPSIHEPKPATKPISEDEYQPQRQQSMQATMHNANTSSYVSEASDYGDGFNVTPPSPPRGGRTSGPAPINTSVAAQPLEAPVPRRPVPEQQQNHGLGVEGADYSQNRLSVVVRPLPVEDPTDNPEQRANRIRSFYKEYFDESKPDPVGQYDDGYYDDYYGEYLADGTVFDPDSGSFVVAGHPGAPYAQPVTRRAMTPPPRGPPRMRGPPGRGPPRGPRSSAGSQGRYMAPRGRSVTSNNSGQYKKPRPPPGPLRSLPTPHLIKEDSMTFNALDFAPPTSFREMQNGRRPDSPLGVARPYSPSVAPHVPLASPYNELSAMPSPHLLRKSGTFTALDFAPPPRFKTSDNNSDAGSIRSNRSGMSNLQIANMRAGAYRLSRIPKELAGTKGEMNNALKPTWDFRGKA